LNAAALGLTDDRVKLHQRPVFSGLCESPVSLSAQVNGTLLGFLPF